jgi:hypothetical protein
MQPSRHNCLYASFVLLTFFLFAPRTRAETLTITSSPAGATVEIDGLVAGTTPYKTDYPGGYFHKPHTVFASRLDHSMTVQVSKDGYLSQRVTLTEGPFEWDAVTGRRHGNYFLLKSGQFDIKLNPISQGGRGPTETIGHDGPLRPASEAVLRASEEEAQPAVGSVTIASDPQGAEIYVDGKFVGQTPSTIHLASGSHHIEVKSKGKQEWERDLDVMKDSQLTLDAILEESP